MRRPLWERALVNMPQVFVTPTILIMLGVIAVICMLTPTVHERNTTLETSRNA